MMSRLTPLEGTTMVTWLALAWTCRMLSSSETQTHESASAVAGASASAHRNHPANRTAARNFLPQCADPRPERAPYSVNPTALRSGRRQRIVSTLSQPQIMIPVVMGSSPIGYPSFAPLFSAALAQVEVNARGV